jgi:hypothetical protein
MIEIPKFGYRAAKIIDSSDLFTMSSASFSNFPVKLQGLEQKVKIELFSLHTHQMQRDSHPGISRTVSRKIASKKRRHYQKDHFWASR